MNASVVLNPLHRPPHFNLTTCTMSKPQPRYINLLLRVNHHFEPQETGQKTQTRTGTFGHWKMRKSSHRSFDGRRVTMGLRDASATWDQFTLTCCEIGRWNGLVIGSHQLWRNDPVHLSQAVGWNLTTVATLLKYSGFQSFTSCWKSLQIDSYPVTQVTSLLLSTWGPNTLAKYFKANCLCSKRFALKRWFLHLSPRKSRHFFFEHVTDLGVFEQLTHVRCEGLWMLQSSVYIHDFVSEWVAEIEKNHTFSQTESASTYYARLSYRASCTSTKGQHRASRGFTPHHQSCSHVTV